MQNKILLTELVFIFGLLGGCTSLFLDRYIDSSGVSQEELHKIDTLDLQAVTREPNEVDAKHSAAEHKTEASDPPPKEMVLSIEQCRALALENNLDLKVQLFNPTISAQNVARLKAAFEPLVFSNLNFVKTDTPTSLRLNASEQKYLANTAGLTIPLHTGGTVTISQPFNRVKTNNIFSTLNPAYSADLSFSLDQPLLRNGGTRTATHALRIAAYNSRISQAQTKLEVIRVLAAVDRVYWRLYAARRLLEVRKQEHDLAVTQLESARRKVKAGQVAEIEVVRAEDAVAQKLESIILAENEVRDRERELKQSLNKAGLGMETPTILVAATAPNDKHYILDTTKLLKYAYKHRMELVELELQLLQDRSNIDFAKNGMLPLLTANYTYNINGLGPTTSDAYDLLFQNRFGDHQFGLQLQIPLGNQAARSRWLTAILQKHQRLANKRQRKLMIKKEVLDAADQLEANWQRIIASRQSAILAARTLQAEQRQFDLGLETSTELLDAQTSYANARVAEIQALVEYQIAQVDLAYATGSLLGAAQIHWKPEGTEPGEKYTRRD